MSPPATAWSSGRVRVRESGPRMAPFERQKIMAPPRPGKFEVAPPRPRDGPAIPELSRTIKTYAIFLYQIMNFALKLRKVSTNIISF